VKLSPPASDRCNPVNRRGFCKTGLLASAALLLKPAASALGASDPELTSGDRATIDFVTGYSSACFLQGGCVLGLLSETAGPVIHLVAEMSDSAAFVQAWKQPPAANVYAGGNTFSYFRGDGVFVAIEHLSPADYAGRQQDLAAGSGISFAHEALTFTPATGAVSDPFRAAAGDPPALRVLPGAPAANPAEVFFAGTLAAAYFGLALNGALQSLKHSALGAEASSASAAHTAASTFATMLPALAGVKSPAAIQTLLATPLLSSSLSRVYGDSASQAAAKFHGLRASAGAGFSNGAVWLSAVLGKVIRQGRAGINLVSADPFVAWQARVALDQARQIITRQ
jgi:hypothetical protein